MKIFLIILKIIDNKPNYSGFVHEHSRPDLDDYVVIFPENIEEGSEGQFTKYSSG